MFKNILVPLDGSRFSSRALEHAVDVAQKYGAHIVLLQAISPTRQIPPVSTTTIESPIMAEITFEQAERQDRRNLSRARSYLKRKLSEIGEKGISGSYHAVIGDPAASILEYCRKEDIDLIVMNTHGRTGLRRAVMGSVADKVIRESGEPVLVVRPRPKRKRKR